MVYYGFQRYGLEKWEFPGDDGTVFILVKEKRTEWEILLYKWAMPSKIYFIKKFDLFVEKMTLFSDLIQKIHFLTNK